MSAPRENQADQLERVMKKFPTVAGVMDKYTNEARRKAINRGEYPFSEKGPYDMHRLTFRSHLGHAYNLSKLKLDGQSQQQIELAPSQVTPKIPLMMAVTDRLLGATLEKLPKQIGEIPFTPKSSEQTRTPP